ncbi:MAG: cysteine--tRNA ligase [Gemmatimonadota bacterium]|nr:cysteine--tRNA ligase [Gemmatimonadota bacterium]
MAGFYIYNTMTRRTERLEPLDPPHVKMYCCGPTVYDYAHIGNYRTFIFQDFLRRSLKLHGFKVTQVTNVTDVDDKTIAGAASRGMELGQYTEPYIKAFFEDLDALRIEKSEHYPRATEHIREIVDLVERLEEKGLAYRSDDSVYFRIDSFPGYGRLSNLDKEGIMEGARVDHDSYDKESVRDFVLWKGGRDETVGWDTSFGRGRPGWHIECSAMAMKYLGESMDIHCGGVDLCFPHHENEIAQSEGATGKTFARYWVHSEHLLVEGRKMSKSLGNYYTFRNLLEKGHKPSAVRYLLLSTHYRSQLNFTFHALGAAASAVGRLRDFKQRLEDYRPREGLAPVEPSVPCAEAFKAALADDLAINTALAALFDYVREVNRLMDRGALSLDGRQKALDDLSVCDTVLDVLGADTEKGDEEDIRYIEKRLEERKKARDRKDYSQADQIRDELISKGIILEDTALGTRWKRQDG